MWTSISTDILYDIKRYDWFLIHECKLNAEEWGLVAYQHLCRKSFHKGIMVSLSLCDYIIYAVTLFNAT